MNLVEEGNNDASEDVAEGPGKFGEGKFDQENNDKPIHSGTDLSLGSRILLILTFVFKYFLSGEGFCHLLILINLHWPSDCRLPQTVY